MKRISGILAAACLVLGAGFAAADDNVGGFYLVAGTNFDGTAYDGAARITMIGTKTCEIVWETGDTSSKGNCMVQGDVVAASYTLSSGHVGLVIYRQVEGVLLGTWTVNNADGEGTEVLTRAE